MSPDTQQAAGSTTAITNDFKGFTDEERAAMKERVRELGRKPAAARARTTNRRTWKPTCSRRSPRCRNRIA